MVWEPYAPPPSPPRILAWSGSPGRDNFPGGGLAPLIIGLFTLSSLQIFLLGFIGEYVMNILTQSRKIPLVVEKERINF